MSAPPAAVLWDLDGTLIRGEELWEIAFGATARALGITLDRATRVRLVGADVDASVEMILTRAQRPITQRAREVTRHKLLATVAMLYTSGVDWKPGAVAALHRLREAGIPLGLVTNTPRQITDLAINGSPGGYFDVTVCADEVPAGKPAPDPYQRAAQLLDVPIGACVAIEDSPDGVRSADTAGAAVLVVPDRVPVRVDPRHTHRADLLGLDVAELSAVLDRAYPTRAYPALRMMT